LNLPKPRVLLLVKGTEKAPRPLVLEKILPYLDHRLLSKWMVRGGPGSAALTTQIITLLETKKSKALVTDPAS
jgi:hypothetical protein